MGNSASAIRDVVAVLKDGDASSLSDASWCALLGGGSEIRPPLTPSEVRMALSDETLRATRAARPDNLLTLVSTAVSRAEALIEPDRGAERYGPVVLSRDADALLGTVRVLTRVLPFVVGCRGAEVADDPPDARAIVERLWGDATRAAAPTWRRARALASPGAPSDPPAPPTTATLGDRVASLVLDLLFCPGFTTLAGAPPDPSAPPRWDPIPAHAPGLAVHRAEILRLFLALAGTEAMCSPPRASPARPFLDLACGGSEPRGIPAGRAFTHEHLLGAIRATIVEAAAAGKAGRERLACAAHCALAVLDYEARPLAPATALDDDDDDDDDDDGGGGGMDRRATRSAGEDDDWFGWFNGILFGLFGGPAAESSTAPARASKSESTRTDTVDVADVSATGDFQPSAAFAGARPGFYFRAGDAGLGYYRDVGGDVAEDRSVGGDVAEDRSVGGDVAEDCSVPSAARSSLRSSRLDSNPFAAALASASSDDRAALHDALLAMLRSGLPSSYDEVSPLATYLGVSVGSESSASDAPFEEAAATLAHALRVDEAFFEHATSADAKCGLPLAFTLLALAMRRRRDGDAGGFAQCACFALLRLSSSRNFGAALNAHVSPRWLPELELTELDGGTWRGTHADALVATTHALLMDGDASRTAPLISPLLTTLHNAAPHWKNLSSRTSTRLVRLVERHARPETLFAQPDAYRDQLRELTGALSPIDRCLRHQPDENPRLVLAVLRGGAVFDALDAAGRGEMPTFDDRNPHRDRDGDDSYDDVYDSDDTFSCATSSSSTASEAPPPVARPSAEWLRAIHAELPLATIRRVRRHLAPTVPLGLGSGSGGTKDPALERVESLSASGEVSRVVGPAPPTTVRRFAGDAPEVRRWLRGYAMGLVLLRQQSGGMGFAPLFDAPRVRLFRVVEVRRRG